MSAESDQEFREFMRGRWPAMVRLAYGLTGDLGHAEDVAQAASARGSVVAVVAGVVIGVPAFAHQEALPSPATSHIRVTVNPPGPHWPAGLIASGLLGTTPWSVTVESPKSSNCLIAGTGMALYECSGSLGQPTAADPISFGAEGGDDGADPSYISVGEVRKGVVSARVQLSDGTVLTLHPAVVDGVRFMAFASPPAPRVDSVTAYSGSGQIATAIPYTAPDGFPSFGAWLRPGRAQPPNVTGTFGSGVTATAYLGPWGTCGHLRIGRPGRVVPDDHRQGRQHRAGGGDRGRPAEVLGRPAQPAGAEGRPLDRVRRGRPAGRVRQPGLVTESKVQELNPSSRTVPAVSNPAAFPSSAARPSRPAWSTPVRVRVRVRALWPTGLLLAGLGPPRPQRFRSLLR